MQRNFFGIRKLLKSCWLCNEIKRQVCDTSGSKDSVVGYGSWFFHK